MQHSGTQTFETSRLICRRFSVYDYKDMYKNWASDPRIQFEYGEPVYSTVSDVKTLLNTYIDSYSTPDYYRWTIIEKESNVKSGRVLEKSPMHITDNVERFIRKNTQPIGEICYCIVSNEYHSR